MSVYWLPHNVIPAAESKGVSHVTRFTACLSHPLTVFHPILPIPTRCPQHNLRH